MTRRKKPDGPNQLLDSSAVPRVSGATDEPDVDVFGGALLEQPGDRLAASGVPESMTIHIDLPPAPKRDAPADEVAIRISDVPVSPGTVEIDLPTTSSVDIVPEPVAEESATRLPGRSTGSAYDALLGGPRGTGEVPPLPGARSAWTGEQSSLRPRTGEQPAVRTRTGEQPTVRSITGEQPQLRGLTGEQPSITRRASLRGETSGEPESASMLTADRLIEARRRHEPTGRWNRLVWTLSGHTVNLGDSKAERARKELDHHIAKQFEGGTRFVPILTRKGGVGKTTVTALLGMTLATVREDRIIAVDANPDRGTLSERINKQTRATVRDVVTKAASISGFTDFSTLVSRDETRLDILASDTDPLLSEAFDENDYNVVADLTARFYSMVLTDCGTGIVHSVMRATLNRADSVIIVSGGSVDEARLASETLTWLEANGYGDLVRNAVVALNTATQGTNLVKLDEIEAHFRSRVRDIVRIPYDPQLAAGSVINYRELKQVTKDAARRLAALVVDGLPAKRAG